MLTLLKRCYSLWVGAVATLAYLGILESGGFAL